MRREPDWVVDTNVVLHVLRGSPLGRHLVDSLQLRTRVSPAVISVVTVGELLTLSEANGWGAKKREYLEELLNELVIVDVAGAARPLLERYAALDLASRRAGHEMGKNDLWIAATAVETGGLLLTCDRDFDHLSPTLLRLWRLDQNAASWPSVPP